MAKIPMDAPVTLEPTPTQVTPVGIVLVVLAFLMIVWGMDGPLPEGVGRR